ncbi:hypothetical protein LMTR13_11315 [Bradyrhizobium icense]|uniref:Uncharacterized protein n=1 Tax=Bradyrhizobium icense TaxID=1274631 RepID=A0A1B1UD41_9BRAD|nr:hypothetical protein LMTR13_11315 [Bradyrhizobium icense]
MKADNDNEPFSFISFAALTANVTRYLRLDEQKDQRDDERSSSSDEEKRALERLEFVNRRIRDLRRFEERAAGKRRKR